MTPVAALRDPMTVYCLGQIVYVPHYRRPTEFVGPGYHEEQGELKSLPCNHRVSYSASQLINAGATPKIMFLLDRPKY
jgi:hypothetical protein